MLNELIAAEGKTSLELHDVNNHVLSYIETISEFMQMLEHSEASDAHFRKLTNCGSYLTEELANISGKLTLQIHELDRQDKIQRGLLSE